MAVGLDDVKRIHLIGVGGCSMSGIAQILQKQGHVVTGSDRERSQFTDRLEELGIPVSIPQKGEQVEGAELVIYSAAIKPDNPERAYAREHGIPEMERSVALGQISARYPHVAAISGCHGKTTITSMLAYINEEAKLDATVHVGGFVDLLGGGVKVGDGVITQQIEELSDNKLQLPEDFQFKDFREYLKGTDEERRANGTHKKKKKKKK